MNTTDAPSNPPVVGLPPIRAADQLLRITALVDRTGLRIEGELDRVTLPALILALASTAGSGSFCVDLSGLVFIDVGGLRALVNAAARLQGGHVLTLRSASPQVRRLLELTGWQEAPGLRLEARQSAIPQILKPTVASDRRSQPVMRLTEIGPFREPADHVD